MATARTRPARTPALPPSARRGASAEPDLVASWRRQPPAIRILRAFLGATFVYAGAQKLADPNFLHAGTLDYIGQQLTSFAQGSPIAPVLRTLAHFPVLTGIGIALIEIAVGMGTLLGIAPVTAAAVGLAVNVILFLSATWHVHPYFLGSDSIYTVAWITLALVGDMGVWTARPLIFGPSRASTRAPSMDDGRRRLLIQIAGATAAVVWVLAVLPRPHRGSAATPVPSSPTPATTPTSAPSTTATPPAAGTKIGSAADLRASGFLNFTDPKTGDPAVVVQLSGGTVAGYDAVCTHAGCTVQYDSTQKVLTCPCHGAVFDPARGAQVLQGPAPTPLAAIKVEVASDGNVYTA